MEYRNEKRRQGTNQLGLLAIVIPVLNEAAMLEQTLASALSQPGQIDLLVVDAGSRDGSVEIARSLDVRVIESPQPGRARQMNLGAAQTQGDAILFLHGDTRLGQGASQSIWRALRNPAIAGGAFHRRFEPSTPFLQVTALLTSLRNQAAGWHLGDQGIFARRSIFEQLGGYRLQDRFEDLDFSRRMRALGKLVTLKPAVVTSSRRFARRGPARQTARDFLLTMRYLMGSPDAVRSNGAGTSRDAPEHPK